MFPLFLHTEVLSPLGCADCGIHNLLLFNLMALFLAMGQDCPTSLAYSEHHVITSSANIYAVREAITCTIFDMLLLLDCDVV